MKNCKEKKDGHIDKEKIKEFLDKAVRQIRKVESPDELNRYRKIFRECVPFSLRSYFAAYMLKATFEGRGRSRFRSSARERRGSEGSSTFPALKTPIPFIAEDDASVIFLSIGRNRKVFPKDIIYIIIHNSGIEREHIGEIKIFENYSFVQVLASDAQRVIDALSGAEYKGKKIAASFARRHDEIPDLSQDMEEDEASSETMSLENDDVQGELEGASEGASAQVFE